MKRAETLPRSEGGDWKGRCLPCSPAGRPVQFLAAVGQDAGREEEEEAHGQGGPAGEGGPYTAADPSGRGSLEGMRQRRPICRCWP